MIARALAAIALALVAAPSLAQTVRVQSGDHPGFTRLVLPIGTDREWELQQQDDTEWVLSVTPPVEGFDVSGAFDLIQRTRLADLGGGGDRLALSLACACDLEGFRFDGRFLVIDISDPDPNTPRPETAVEPEPEPDTARRQAAAALPDLADLLGAPSILPNVSISPQVAAPELPLDPSPSEPAAPTGEHNPRLAEAAEIMAEQLARAAAAGLLDASLDQPMTLGDPVERHSPEPQRPATASEVQAPEAPQGHTLDVAHAAPDDHAPAGTDIPAGPLPIRAEGAFDAAIRLDRPISPPRDAGSCQGTPFDVRDWASGTGFDHELGTLRQALYDDRDTLTVEGATQLAQHYLHYGFGAEAAYWLTQLQDPPEALLHVAALVDGAPSAPFPAVEIPEACSQGELLWRYLAGAVAGEMSAEDVSAVQRAFGELPPDLRDQIGPRLARQLARDGRIGTARNIRDTLHRGGRMDDSTLRLLDFDLGISPADSPDDTRTALAEALRDDGGDPVSIMTLALAFDRSIGQRPTASRMDAAEGLLRETGDGPTTDSLWHEVLLGHAALGQVDRALAMLDDTSRTGEIRARALTDLIAERVLVEDTAALVIIAYTHGADWRPEGSAAGRVQVQAIAALREAGLFEAAQILRDVRRPLILPAPEAEPADPEDDIRTAWLDRDWARLAETASGAHADIAARMTSFAPTDPGPPDTDITAPDLDAMAETLGDSRSLRATVAELLARPTPP